MPVHPTAVVDATAHVADDAVVGPFCLVGPNVVLGPGTQLMAHAVVQGRTRLGARNVVHPFACLGGPPQDRKYKGEPSEVWIGDDNVFREGITVNGGTEAGGLMTRIGNGCLVMAYAHVAHDCTLGDGVVLANGVGLAGHVQIGAHATVGGLAAVHQHCRVGRLAFVGGGSMVAQDVLPFCMAQGDRAELGGLNVVGLRRQGWTHAQLGEVRRALAALFAPHTTRAQALAALQGASAQQGAEVAELVAFAAAGTRGLCAPRARGARRAAEEQSERIARDAGGAQGIAPPAPGAGDGGGKDGRRLHLPRPSHRPPSQMNA